MPQADAEVSHMVHRVVSAKDNAMCTFEILKSLKVFTYCCSKYHLFQSGRRPPSDTPSAQWIGKCQMALLGMLSADGSIEK